MRSIFLYLVFWLSSVAVVKGGILQMPGYFGDHMVLQREKPIRIEGQASAEETVKVSLDRQIQEVRADAAGKWVVCLKPMKAGGPYELVVNTTKDTLRFTDILVGDVWFAAGQSNIAFRLKAIKKEDFGKEKAEANFSQIRYYGTAGVVSGGKIVESPDRSWACPQADRVGEWSAVAYLFAKEIYRRYRIPIGIVTCAQGSSTVEAWLSPQAYEENPDLVKYKGKKKEGIQALYRNPSVLYNRMLSKFRGMSVKGIIWYQGESNAYHPADYRYLFQALIRDWRAFFGEPDLPFIYAQLPAYRMPGDLSGEKWAEMRQVQMEITRKVPHTVMVVTSDYGEAENIHPKNKRPVARRFALAAGGLVYGEKILYQIAIPEKAKRIENKAQIIFPDDGVCLVSRGEMMLEIGGPEGTYYPAKYTVKRNCLTVWSDRVLDPVSIRYAYANVNRLALYDRSGVPVSPFCIPVERKE